MSARVLAAMFGVGSFSPEGDVRRGLKAATSARYRAEHPGEFDRIVGDRLAFSPSLSSYLRQAGAGANFDASGRVRDIDAPTLVIHGSDDRLVCTGPWDLLVDGNRLYVGGGFLDVAGLQRTHFTRFTLS